MGRAIRNRRGELHSLQQLGQALQEEWNNLDQQVIRDLIDSMGRRLSVIRALERERQSWERQREIGKCSQKLCSKTSIRVCSPNIPGTWETQKRRPRPSSISIGRLSSRPLVRPRRPLAYPLLPTPNRQDVKEMGEVKDEELTVQELDELITSPNKVVEQHEDVNEFPDNLEMKPGFS
ncbi:hypothetical protein J6590_058690 [Homalodisca vitripennis]|nr:hypothetical protein J6590_058690 [Homalodisca vitripennis]